MKTNHYSHNRGKNNKLHKNQKGLVSILMVMIIMIILSLVVIAFVRLTTREQRQTLDRQLNSQAFYAAESGVNDVERLIGKHPELASRNYTGCSDFINHVNSNYPAEDHINRTIDTDGPVMYSCLIVDPSPINLIYDNVTTNSSIVIPINASGNIQRLNIAWQDTLEEAADISNCPAVGEYPQSLATGCEVGMLRIEYLNSSAAGGRSNLLNNTGVVFAQPGSGPVPAVIFNQIKGDRMGDAKKADCSTGGSTKCSISININGASSTGYLRIRSIYRDARVDISAYGAADGGGPLELRGAQVAVDVTGKANDVLRRIAVRRALSRGTGTLPEYALQSTRSLCKRFTVKDEPPYATKDTGIPGWCSPADDVNP